MKKMIEVIGTYIDTRNARKKIEFERKVAIDEHKFQIELERLKIESELMSSGKVLPENLDRMSMEQMEKSWKDEFILFVLFSPIIFAFFPFSQPAISQGFFILREFVPQWYMYFLAGIVVVTYGLRGMVKIVFGRRHAHAKAVKNALKSEQNTDTK